MHVLPSSEGFPYPFESSLPKPKEDPRQNSHSVSAVRRAEEGSPPPVRVTLSIQRNGTDVVLAADRLLLLPAADSDGSTAVRAEDV